MFLFGIDKLFGAANGARMRSWPARERSGKRSSMVTGGPVSSIPGGHPTPG